MSIDIHWDTLTGGPDGASLAETVRSFVDDKFQDVTLPRFIRSVKVHSFDFGRVAPEIELKDICDPLPDFYEEDEDASSNGEAREIAEEDSTRAASDRPVTEHRYLDRIEKHGSSSADETSTRQSQPPAQFDMRLPALRNIGPAEHLGGSLFPRVSTPGIPGGTSNMSYFHLPLSGLSGTTTPLAAVAGAQFHGGWADFNQHARQAQPQRDWNQRTASPTSSPPSTADPSSPSMTQQQSDPIQWDHRDELRGARVRQDRKGSSSTSPTPRRMRERSAEDVQIVSRVRYSGDVKLSLTAEILLDYPSPSFVGIPLKLNITGLTFDGVAIIAYIRKRAHFCFLTPEDADALIGDDTDLGVSTAGHNAPDHGSARRAKVGGLLEEIKVESEIGQKENGKQVLKNVGKVEKFVLEQVRRIFEDEFVYPSFWTFLV